MVNGISSTNVLQQATTAVKQDDIKTLLKYVNNEALKEVPDTFTSTVKSGVGSAALFEGIPVLNFLRKGHKIKNIRTSDGTTIIINDAMKALDERTSKAFKNIFKGTDGTLGERVAKFIRTQNLTKKDYINLKDATKAANKASNLYSKRQPKETNKVITAIRNFFEASPKRKGKKTGKLMSAIDNAIEKADYFVSPLKTDARNAKLAIDDAARILDDATQALAKKPNSKKLKKAVEKATKNLESLKLAQTTTKQVSRLGKFGKFMKSSGAGIMLVFSGISEACTEVIPTFKELGVKKGLKQLAKSTFKVVSDTAGFIVGEQAGMAIGSAIGTAIMPGIGTAVGAVCGFIGGMVGSFAAGKLTKGLFGNSEREIAKEQIQQEQAKILQADTASLEELKKSAIAKIEQEAANGELSEDSQIALQTLQNMEQTNPFSV